MRWRVLPGLLLLPLLAGTLSACSGSARQEATSTRVALFGDSLAWEAQPYYAKLLEAAKENARTYNHGGTAICDWFSRMHEVESRYHPEAVELEFSGNNLTPCMSGYQSYSTAFYEKYRADTLKAIDIFVPAGAHVYLIGAPITRQQQQSVPGWQRLNLQYKQIADADPGHVTYVDAGTAVEGANHTYTDTLPCLEDEPCTGPVVDGVRSNIVRSPDGGHFCPNEEGNQAGVIGGCTVFSSGAYRFAKAMVEALGIPLHRLVTP